MVLPEKIKAAIFAGEGKLEIVQRPLPVVKEADDVLIKVEVCGICGTDLRFLSVPPVLAAKPGVILGHEHVGKVVALGGGVKGFQVGDRVAVMPDVPCGYCRSCREGRPNLCENIVSIGGDLDGGFAEYVVHPARTLIKVPDSLPREKAAFIELLSCVSSGVEKAAPMPGENVLIIGAGPAGLTYMKLFKAAGAGQVMMAEISPWRADFALKAGATRVINPRSEDLPGVVNQLTDGRGADIVVDALGFGLEMAVSCAGRRARIIIFGEDARAQCTIRPVDIQHRELRILGSFIGSFNFPKAIQMLESDVVKVTDLITHQVSLDELPGAIKQLASGQGAKGICLM
jgi:threonine dehydrogenase-like Zn-dependent dehydrogenase